MDAFLAAALAPKARNKRKATTSVQANGGDSSRSTGSGSGSGSGGRTASADDAKRPRPRGASLAKETKTMATVTETTTKKSTATIIVTSKETTTATTTTNTNIQPAAPMLSFRAAMSGQGKAAAGPTRTRLILEKAAQLQEKGRLDDAYNLLLRALIACVCHAQLRSQFKDAGVPLEAIDPVGQCSCRDFVEAAQKRKPQTISAGFGFGFGGPAAAAKNDDSPFPITELDLSSVYNLATNSPACTCGSGRIRCTEPDHLAALDRLAAVAGKLSRHDDVSRIGQWYMDLAPQNAEGYLHVAKAVLAITAAKKKDGRLKADVQREREQARFAARCLYTHGLHNVKSHGDADSSLAQVLARCCRQYSHDDYLPELPVETVENIFQHLSLSDILKCRRVSKKWALVLKRVRLRPAQIVFKGPKEAPIKGLQSLLRQMPDLKTNHLGIMYPNGRDTLQAAKFVTLALGHFKDAESLELKMWAYTHPTVGRALVPFASVTTSESVETRFSAAPTSSKTTTIEARLGQPPLPPLPAVSKCRRLVLHGLENYELQTAADCLIAWASQSLDYLELNGHFWGHPISYQLPRLRCLKMTNSLWGLGRPGFNFMATIFMASTQLEQLYLDHIRFFASPEIDDESEDEVVLQLGKSFEHLHTLVIGPKCTIHGSLGGPAGYGGLIVFPPLPPGLRCLDILTSMDGLAHRILFGRHYDPRIPAPLNPGEFRPLEHLESFRCTSPVTIPPHIFQLIEPSLCRSTGRLAHLEINARDIGTDFLHGRMPHMRIPFPERIKTIGLYDFNWGMPSIGSDAVIRDRVALDWLSQFRNAETISVYPAWRHAAWANDGSEGGRFVLALVEQSLRQAEVDARKAAEEGEDSDISQHLKLRTIYQGMLHGAMLERSKKLLGNHPIRIPQGHFDHRPPVFPWPDREEEEEKDGGMNDLRE